MRECGEERKTPIRLTGREEQKVTEVEERGGEVECAGVGAVILSGKQREERRRCAKGE